MNEPALSTATSLTRAWVRFYTLGVARTNRERRRGEIESDLWEHRGDALDGGTRPARIGLQILGRLLRGVPSDIAWRVRAEGAHMSLNIPVNRAMGGLLLLMAVLLFVAGSINGYDTSRDAWPSEMERLARVEAGPGSLNVALQIVAGSGLILCAALLFSGMRGRSPGLVSAASFALAASGVMFLVTSAFYAAVINLAGEWEASSGASADQLLITARGFGLGVVATSTSALFLLIAAIVGFAMVIARERLAPRWLGWFAAIAAGLALGGFAIPHDETAWITGAIGFLSLALWLLLAGGWMALDGGSRATPAPAVPANP